MYPNDPCVWRPPCRPRTGRIDERNCLFTTVDCGLSISTRWISSVIAVGGAILGSVFIWTLAFIFLIVAIFGLAKLSAQPIRIAQTGEVFTPLGTDI